MRYYYNHHLHNRWINNGSRTIATTATTIVVIITLLIIICSSQNFNHYGVIAFTFHVVPPPGIPTVGVISRRYYNKEQPASVAGIVASRRQTSSCLYGTSSNRSDDDDDDDNKNMSEEEEKEDASSDIQSARQQLEALLRQSSTTETSKETKKSKLDPDMVSQALEKFPPPLTTMGRTRYDTELKCLSSLQTSDKPVEDLWNLWFSERGPEACAELEVADQLMMTGRVRPQDWDASEKKLKDLIEQHGLEWAEPINRLATLMYLRGNLEESKRLCEIVLEIKPWHFGALSGIVMVCTALQDVQEAKRWAARRLPPFVEDSKNNKQRRTQWVERAVKEALQIKQRAEQRVWENLDNDDNDNNVDSSTSMDKKDEAAAAGAGAPSTGSSAFSSSTSATTSSASVVQSSTTSTNDEEDHWQ